MSDVVVIGAGIGGLMCGAVLSRNGKHVQVLEQYRSIGGAFQTFSKGGFSFSPGMHYVGSVSREDTLGKILACLDLSDLPWCASDYSEEVIIDGRQFFLPVGYDAFLRRMNEYFPEESEHFERYVLSLQEISSENQSGGISKAFGLSANEFLERIFDNPLIIRVLAGPVLRMTKDLSLLSLYEYAQITDSFIRGTYRLRGNAEIIPQKLKSRIIACGGEVLTGKKVISINGNTLTCSDGTSYCGEYIVSGIHPANLVKMAPALRSTYRSRVSGLKNNYGVFTVFLGLRPESIQYVNHSISIDNEITIHMGVPSDGHYAVTMEIMAPIDSWPEERGEAYSAWKKELEDRYIDMASKRFPALRDNIAVVFSSTPLTWERYTGSPFAFGIQKDYHSPSTTILGTRTPDKRLLLTGQNSGLHGLLGVAMSALNTSGAILGRNLIKKIL